MHPKGFATVTTLLIVSGLLLAVGIALHVDLRNHYDDMTLDVHRIQARELGLSCLEEGRYQASRDPLFTSMTLTYANGTCSINVTKTGNNYMITTEAQVQDVTKQFQLDAEVVGGLITPTRIQELL